MSVSLTDQYISVAYGQLLHVDGGLSATRKTMYDGLGVASALLIGTGSVAVDNLLFDGNTISSLDTNGNIVITPNGTGTVVISKAQITGGSIAGITDLAIADGGTGASNAANARANLGCGNMAVQDAGAVAITGGTISGVSLTGSFVGTTSFSSDVLSALTTLNGGNLRLNGNTISSTNANGNVVISPDGSGEVLITKPFGYGGTGTGGTATQSTSKTTSVALNKLCGQITMAGDSLSAGAVATFTFTNSFIDATDVVLMSIASAATAGAYSLTVDQVAAGSCRVSVRNVSGGSLSEALVINFVVIKGVSA